MADAYTRALTIDKEESHHYYRSSIATKSKQQERLEQLLISLAFEPDAIADIACGGGGTAYHLGRLFPAASYALVDLNADAIEIARETTAGLDVTCVLGDVYDLPLADDFRDLVICWQTLSWLVRPEVAIKELLRICRPGGRIFASSLFNTEHDVDILSTVMDHTRASSAQGLSYAYNTYAACTVEKWVADAVSRMTIHEFELPIDIAPRGRGLGTYTIPLDNGRRLQISGGMLLNWGILELAKS